MAIIQCSKKHYYDNEKFDECPHCRKIILQGKWENQEDEIKKHSIDINKNFVISGEKKSDNDAGKTVSIISKNKNPVSGWIVCTGGENKGRSFELHIGKNFVGRSMKSDVIINDPQFSRLNHFSIVFEPNTCIFYILPGESVVQFNGEVLEHSCELGENDIIEAGSSIFVFIPFCKGGRNWNE